ncbi:hypothetical protein AVEN_252112-1 [Araneus ventricosus]|uniref:Uncharacterized protein n=1 Tax=Araneus ventricosus TaxID=182803 RepID=A0A4Y2M8U5_ARAVE|nr:hypothetical protein AVEN_252112-1 [Araneus ventricosus]
MWAKTKFSENERNRGRVKEKETTLEMRQGMDMYSECIIDWQMKISAMENFGEESLRNVPGFLKQTVSSFAGVNIDFSSVICLAILNEMKATTR